MHIILLTGLLCGHAHAFTAQVRPGSTVPGGIVLLNVVPSEESKPLAEFNGKGIELYPSAEGAVALIPIPLDTAPGEYPVTIIAGDEKVTCKILVTPHVFETKKLTLPEEKVVLSPRDQERAAREAEMLSGMWTANTQQAWNGRFSRPTDTDVSEVFGVKRIMNGKRTSVHQGMDFRGSTGTPVMAINSGTVVLTGDLFFGGQTVVLDHGMGLYSVYMHLSEFRVAKGDAVSRGQVVGLVGSTGRATGPHLHFGVKLHGVSVNPDALFGLPL